MTSAACLPPTGAASPPDGCCARTTCRTSPSATSRLVERSASATSSTCAATSRSTSRAPAPCVRGPRHPPPPLAVPRRRARGHRRGRPGPAVVEEEPGRPDAGPGSMTTTGPATTSATSPTGPTRSSARTARGHHQAGRDDRALRRRQGPHRHRRRPGPGRRGRARRGDRGRLHRHRRTHRAHRRPARSPPRLRRGPARPPDGPPPPPARDDGPHPHVLDERFGGAGGWLVAQGWTEDQVEELRRRLVGWSPAAGGARPAARPACSRPAGLSDDVQAGWCPRPPGCRPRGWPRPAPAPRWPAARAQSAGRCRDAGDVGRRLRGVVDLHAPGYPAAVRRDGGLGQRAHRRLEAVADAMTWTVPRWFCTRRRLRMVSSAQLGRARRNVAGRCGSRARPARRRAEERRPRAVSRRR